MAHAGLGELIHTARDEQGEIHVYQDDQYRYLTFGNLVEQSCMALANPVRLVHAYTQAMMLALLFGAHARDALLLGIGGGSLARALRAARPKMRLTGIEVREAVISTAQSHFNLPDDERFSVQPQDARQYLQTTDDGFDLIFADLYEAEGVHPDQVDVTFMRSAHERLSDEGILVVNQWASEFAETRGAASTLSDVFEGQVISVHVQGGNIISFAFRDELPDLKRDVFFDAAQSLGLKLDTPLQRHARNLWRQNAEILAVGRFRHRGRSR